MALGTSWKSGSWGAAVWAAGTWKDAISWAATVSSGGTAFGPTGIMGSIFVDDGTAVPATAIMCNGFAHHQDGRRYVALWPGSGAVYHTWNGIAVRSDGAMLISPSGTIAEDSGGLSMTFRGEVVVQNVAPTFWDDGMGELQDGTLCISDIN
jgi:hypothetical protein